MFKKILASVGIGAAKVDTILETEHLQPGQLFNAQIVITAGNVSQEISGLDLLLMTRVKVAGDDGDYFTNHVIDQWRITEIGKLSLAKLKVFLLRRVFTLKHQLQKLMQVTINLTFG